MLTCSKCGCDKPESEFSIRKDRARGRNSQCKACIRLVNKANYDANAEKNRIYAAEYRKNNPNKEYQAAYRDKHRAELRAYYREYAKANPSEYMVKIVARRAKKLNATPAWADKTAIATMYRMAANLRKWLGKEFHVDHIVPLVSPIVCGLHCEANLQVVKAVDNLKKGNITWPDMP